LATNIYWNRNGLNPPAPDIS